MEPCLRSMLTSSVTVRSVVSLTEGGSEVLGPARVLRAYIERRTQTKTGGPAGSTERRSDHLVVTEDEISPDDRVWLAGTDTASEAFSRRPESIVVYRHPISGAVDHYEVTL